MSWLLVTVIGFAWRMLLPYAFRFDETQGDAAAYLAMARGLLEHGTLCDVRISLQPTYYRPPGYPAFVAAVHWVNTSPWLLHTVQALMSALVAAWLMRQLRRLDVGQFAYRVWFALIVLSPFDALYSRAHLSEGLAASLLVFALGVPLKRRTRGAALLVGCSLGALCLVRDIFLLMLPLAAWCFPAQRGRRTKSALVLLGAMLVIAPWTVRNYLQSGRPIAVSAGRLGYSLWLGTWATNGDFTSADATNTPREYPRAAFTDAAQQAEFVRWQANSDDSGFDTFLKQAAWQRWRDQPLSTLWAAAKRLPRLWIATRTDLFTFRFGATGSVPWWAMKIMALAWNGAAVALALLALPFYLVRRNGVSGFRFRRLSLWWALPLVYVTSVLAPLNSFEARYSQPVLLVLCVWAGLAMRVLRGVKT